MARYKPFDTSPRFIAVNLERQLLPGSFEHALNHLIDHEVDLSDIDDRYKNNRTGAAGDVLSRQGRSGGNQRHGSDAASD